MVYESIGQIVGGVASAGASVASAKMTGKMQSKQNKMDGLQNKVDKVELQKTEGSRKAGFNANTEKIKSNKIKLAEKQQRLQDLEAKAKSDESTRMSATEGSEKSPDAMDMTDTRDQVATGQKQDVGKPKCIDDPELGKQTEAQAQKEVFEQETEISQLKHEIADLNDDTAKRMAENDKFQKDDARLEELKDVKIEKGDETPEKLSKMKKDIKALQKEVDYLKGMQNVPDGIGKLFSAASEGAGKILAAGYKKDAAFLEADAGLTDATRGMQQAVGQGMLESIRTMDQGMKQDISMLAQLLQDQYQQLSIISRNI